MDLTQDTPRPVTLGYDQLMRELNVIADDPSTDARLCAGASFILELNKMPDGKKRVEHFMPRAMNAAVRGDKIILYGGEKAAVVQVSQRLLDAKEKRALKQTMHPDDASKISDINRRQWNGIVSSTLGWAMLVTLCGKTIVDRQLNKTTEKVRKQQLRGLVEYVQQNPPPPDEAGQAAYFDQMDRNVKHMVGTVRDQYPWLNVISASGAGILIALGGRSREKAKAAANDHNRVCAEYAANVVEKALRKAMQHEAEMAHQWTI